MSDYDNTNRGALFKNDRKEQGDRKPEYSGSLNVDGVEYFLDAWLKTSQAGQKFMSVSVKRKDKQPSSAGNAGTQTGERRDAARGAQMAAQQPRGGATGFDDFSDEIPFITSSTWFDDTTSKARRMARYK